MTPSHSDLLADSLSKLEASQTQTNTKTEGDHPVSSPGPRIHEGYGFRPPSGITTPLIASATAASENMVPDPNGLGWPGKSHARGCMF